MTIKELKGIIATANDNDVIEIANGEIKLIKQNPIKHKFNVGDYVFYMDKSYKVTKQLCSKEPMYAIRSFTEYRIVKEIELSPYNVPDITRLIKTFEDACYWCNENGKMDLVWPINLLFTTDWSNDEFNCLNDIFAYMQLRIITAALNEGWETNLDACEERWRVTYDIDKKTFFINDWMVYEDFPKNLVFKSENLATYAATQFSSIYKNFFGLNDAK